MANNKNFIAKNGVSTGDGYAMPNVRPTAMFDFQNSKSIDPRLIFTRGTTGTYWDGFTSANAQQNLLYPSNGTGMLVVSASKTTGQSAPNGGSDAVKIVPSATLDRHILYQYKDSGVDTSNKATSFSVFAKAAGYNYLQVGYFRDGQGAEAGIVVDLTDGSIDSTQGTLDSSNVTDWGNGWYRIRITKTVSYSNNMGIILAVSDVGNPGSYTAGSPEFTANGTDGVTIWGIQAEQRAQDSPLLVTTTKSLSLDQPILQTAAVNTPRFDHDPVTGESKGLLTESYIVNQVPNSKSTAFTYNVSVKGDRAMAPDGTYEAEHVVYNASGGAVGLWSGTKSPTTGWYTWSSFFKYEGIQYIRMYDNNANKYADFDILNGTYLGGTNSRGGVIDCGNGWYRCFMTANVTTGSTYFQIYAYDSLGGGADNDINSFNGILVWGHQVENNPFLTSFVLTGGSTVSRSADLCYSTNADVLPKGTFSVLAKASLPYDNTTTNINASMFSYGPDRIQLRYDDGVGAQFLLYNSAAQADLNYGAAQNSGTTAVVIGSNNLKFSTKGTSVAQDSGAIFDKPESLYLGNLSNSTEALNGHLQKIAVYGTALSDDALSAVTED